MQNGGHRRNVVVSMDEVGRLAELFEVIYNFDAAGFHLAGDGAESQTVKHRLVSAFEKTQRQITGMSFSSAAAPHRQVGDENAQRFHALARTSSQKASARGCM